MDNSIITVRDIQTVTAEINVIKSNVQQTVLSGAIEIGRRLVEAKTMVPHGEWGKWLEHDAQISSRQAQRFIQLFDEYGSQQIGFFGNANPSLMSNMPYTKALKLLVIPEEEREAFVEENNVAEISNAELDKLIKERDAAKAAAAKAEEDRSKLMSSVDKVMKDSEAAAADLKKARKAAETAEAAAEKAKADAEKAIQAEKAARDKLAAKEQELAELRAHPEVPEAKLEEIRAEAEKLPQRRQEKAGAGFCGNEGSCRAGGERSGAGKGRSHSCSGEAGGSAETAEDGEPGCSGLLRTVLPATGDGEPAPRCIFEGCCI